MIKEENNDIAENELYINIWSVLLESIKWSLKKIDDIYLQVSETTEKQKEKIEIENLFNSL